MGADPSQNQNENGSPAEGRPGPLVPLYGGTDIVPGIQAFRRGDIVLYTVRGEPELVQELIGRLDREGIGELVAFISHRTGEEEADEQGD
ncbi:MAG: hypothetical protein R6V05_14375 [Candidatus Brocadiia bacterium]